ncbi:MAG: type IV pilus secretin PilQ [Desulfobacterales bacterium]|uniref:Type IV pilus secretin PilQ n=1 Tax=Candidatus Desulfaltia bathyphila TaxID=2841697 RepID=A0A8J6TCM3_9BACT|nr:type IV pilus secretin PilQ [Candidatus Desulfaltia bathyphila]MBL7195672.1 type IV pilus secretin PilQ [Desulfobacterales bacterium]MBL7207145.1 type IV pilus secretin PilQ [Desulfobacterales bacterium]
MFYKIIKFSKTRALSILLIILMMLFAGCASSKAVKQADQEEADQKVGESLNLITDISTAEGSESLAILIKAERLLTYTSVKQPMPLGVVLYFPETGLGEIEAALILDSDIVASIKASELTENGHTSRIEIALKKDAAYEVFREGNGLQILFAKAGKITASAEISIPAETAPKEDKDEKPAWVNRVDFSSENAGKSTIIIGTTRPVKYKMDKAADKRLQLTLFNTNLSDYRKRPLITTRFNSAVDRITPTQTPALKTSSMIVIELRESVPYYIEQADDLLLVHFDPSSIPPRPFEQADLPSWKKAIAQTAVKAKEIKEKKVEDKVLRPKIARKYTGEKIALDFYDTDIKNVFLILREVSGKNFAIDKDVAGRVTLTLAKPVSWDQVFDLILKMNQLGQTPEGNIIRIATLETLKKEEDFKQAEIIAMRKAREEQKTLEPLVTEYIPVNYSNAETDILPHLEKILTKDRGSAAAGEDGKSTETAFGGASVSADRRTNMIIMTDVAEKIKQAREIVKQLDKVTPQVMIEARIVEASDKFSREIGVDWHAGTADNQRTALINSSGLNAKLGYNAAVNLPFSLLNASTTAGTMGFRVVGSQFVLDAAILAYESQGDLKIVSSPKILTLDNKKAVIKQGASYPIQKYDESGNTTTEYKDIELVLEVTPHITPDKRISMIIKITKDDIGLASATTSPWFTTKGASTELLVDDGNTIVIGGIIKRTKQLKESRVPWLSKIPVLGWLFKTEYKKDFKEELLIFITPKIVQLEQQSDNAAYK